MRVPQGHTRGSTSKIFLTRRAHVLGASLGKAELSFSVRVSATHAAALPTADGVVTLARLL
jgi:hypothetical protein